MTSISTYNILANPLKVDSQQYLPLPIKEPCLNDEQHNNNAHDINAESDYWHYNIGINVIPVDSKNKRPALPRWKEWQNNPITDEQHEQRKKDNSYQNGIAVVASKIWRGINKDKHLVVIDIDNKQGIDDFINHCFPELKTLEGLSQTTIVEQHSDNKDKAHVYFIAKKPLINRGSIGDTSKKEDLPIIEIKSQGKSYVVCSPSIHKMVIDMTS